MSTDLLERMKKLREKSAIAKATADTSTTTTSSCIQATTLATFLCLYNKSGRECYINYMEGAKALHKYLSPIAIPDIAEELLPKHCPALFHAYEVGALANIFYPTSLVGEKGNLKEGKLSADEFFAKTTYLERVIIYLTCKEIADDKLSYNRKS